MEEKKVKISVIIERIEEIKNWLRKEAEAQREESEKIAYELEKLKKYVEEL